MSLLKEILKIRGKYTIVKFGEFGFPESRQFILAHISYKLIQDVPRYLIIASVKAGEAGWNKFISISRGEQFILWEGYHEVNTSRIVTRTRLNNVECNPKCQTFLETRWPKLDARYMIRAKNSVKTKPLIEKINDLQPETLLTYQIISSN